MNFRGNTRINGIKDRSKGATWKAKGLGTKELNDVAYILMGL